MTASEASAAKRPYRSPRRVEQAAQTRAAVLSAAVTLFTRRGWTATGMRDVAQEAGVAIETVYSNFRSKPELLMSALDVSVVGDADPVPLADRPGFTALAVGTFDQRVAAAARLVTEVHERTAGLHVALRQAAASEPELAQRLKDGESRRRVNIEQGARLITGGVVPTVEVDSLWVLTSVDVFRLLTELRDWSVSDYQEWVAREMADRLRAGMDEQGH